MSDLTRFHILFSIIKYIFLPVKRLEAAKGRKGEQASR
jgi:hypothetical protein